MCAPILRGAFCVLPSPPLPPSPARGRGGYGVRKRSFRPTLKLTLQHSIGSAHCVGEGLGARAKQHAPSRTQARGIWSAEAKLPPDAEGAACRAPTPLSHRVGEGRGVRAKERACLAATAHGKIAPAPEILYLTAVPLPAMSPSPARRRGGYGVRKRSFRPTLKLTLQHSIGSAHCVGEGLGVRAKQHAPSRTQARGIWSAEAKLPPDAEANASALHRVGALRGRGVRDEGKTTRPPLPQGGRGAGGEGKTACAPTITPRGWWCASRVAGTRSALG
jgi:hypothetical protein